MTYVDEYPGEAKLVRACLAVAFAALGIGAFFGLIQALHRTGAFRGFVSNADYYTVLTAHGVLLALVYTTFFITGLFVWGVTKSLGRPLEDLRFTWAWFGTMLAGTLLAVVSIAGGFFGVVPWEADVLFTFYAPLEATPAFYVGLALIIVGSWLAGIDYFRSYRAWRAENPDERVPLQTFMALATWVMWYVCTIGVAVEVVALLIPWSLGLIRTVDPLLTRTLFWYFGHPVVYFWLMPAYFVWYTILPKLAGGRLLSDPLARVVFVLFVVLSTPTGFHHQYTDPGIPEGFKFLAMSNTMFLLLPSLLTAFTVVASLEHGARQRGGEGRLKWLRALPWDNPSFAAIALAGLMFAAGGFSGMVNAGMNLNYLIHNTIWVPGHFHLTVGTASALTFMGMTYWLLPQITGKRLRWPAFAVLQPYLWFIGMVLFSNAMHRAGLLGVPRRTAVPQYEAFAYEGGLGGYDEMRIQIALGGILLFISSVLFVSVVARTWLADRSHRIRVDSTIPAPLSPPEAGPRVLDDLRLWGGLAVLLVVLAYAVPLGTMVADGISTPGSAPVPVGIVEAFRLVGLLG